MEKDKISNNILKWSVSNERFLNVISIPYNSSEIFIKVILHYVERGKKVIYITNENYDEINILDEIKKRTNFRDYTYIKSPQININARLRVCNFSNAIKLEEKFDLVIYDDIRSFPSYSKYEILNLMSKMSNEKYKTNSLFYRKYIE